MGRSQGYVFTDRALSQVPSEKSWFVCSFPAMQVAATPKIRNYQFPGCGPKCILTKKKKFLVKEKRLKAQRQILLCLPISLQHYFKVMLKPIPITQGHLSLPSILKSYSSAPVQTGRLFLLLSFLGSDFLSFSWLQSFSEGKGRKLLSAPTT